jgi:hypothetical protein
MDNNVIDLDHIKEGTTLRVDHTVVVLTKSDLTGYEKCKKCAFFNGDNPEDPKTDFFCMYIRCRDGFHWKEVKD